MPNASSTLPLKHLPLSEFRQADPWPAEIDAAVRAPGAQPLCINCLYPHEGPHQWFCPHCKYATGDRVPLMSYLYIYPMAEMMRRGVMGSPERRVGTQVFLAAAALVQYSFFAPVYWFWMFRRARGRPICHERRVDIPEEARR